MEISQALKNARLTGARDFMDTGSNPAQIDIYGGTPPTGGAAPSGSTPLLATMVLQKPCGAVSAGVLTLAAADPLGPLVSASGEARWARCLSGNGAWAFDCLVWSGESGQTSGMVIGGTASGPDQGAQIYLGGRLPPVQLRIEE